MGNILGGVNITLSGLMVTPKGNDYHPKNIIQTWEWVNHYRYPNAP